MYHMVVIDIKLLKVKNDGPPVETSITLNFKEMELITRERVFEGF